MDSSHRSEVSTNTPRGLPNPLASLAWSRLSPIPIVDHRRVRSSTRSWIARANASGSSVVTARKASSHPATSTSASNERSVSITSRLAARYASESTGRKMASGLRLYAVRSGIALRIPNTRAS